MKSSWQCVALCLLRARREYGSAVLRLAVFLVIFSYMLAMPRNAMATPITINSVFDLQNIQGDLAGSYVLGGDIDASATAAWNGGAGFLPIGLGVGTFAGTFDGGGHTINGLTINSSVPFSGLFSTIGFTGSVSNLNLVNVAISSSQGMLGSLAGNNNGTITSVTVSGSVTSTATGGLNPFVGGIVGQNGGGSIITSSSAASISSAASYGTLGGLAGLNYGLIKQSAASGTVTGSGYGQFLGGITAGGGGVVSQSLSSASVNAFGSGSKAGGLEAENFNGQISQSLAVGNVQGGQPANGNTTAGLAVISNTPVIASYWDIQSTGQPLSAAGIGLTTAQLTSGSLPAGFDPAVWTATAGQYPRLSWQNVDVQPPIQIPPPAVLARLANDAYAKSESNISESGFNLLTGPGYTIVGPNTFNGFGVATFRSTDNPNLIVIAVRGTDPTNESNFDANVIADNSFKNGVANSALTQDVIDLIGKVAFVHNHFPDAQIILTGHSLGGALAQIVGSAAGIGVISFDAPGAGNLFDPKGTAPVETQLAQLAGFHIASPSQEITNYRLYGDQVSLVRLDNALGNIVTVSQINPPSVVDDLSLDVDWDLYHSLTTLFARLSDLCGQSHATPSCATQTDGASGRSIVGTVVTTEGTVITAIFNATDILADVGGGATKVANAYGNLWTQTADTYSNWLAKAGELWPWDPRAGFGYLFELQSGSPFIQSLLLPCSDPVFGWELQYKDENGWSSPQTACSPESFNFTTDVNSLLFFPLDIDGDPTFNPNPFFMGLSFQTDGEVNATLQTFGPASVPEPETLVLFCSGLFAVATLRRKRSRTRLAALPTLH